MGQAGFWGVLSTEELGFLLGVHLSGWGSQWWMAVGSQDHVKGTQLRLAREGVWNRKGSKIGVFEGFNAKYCLKDKKRQLASCCD